MPYKDNEKRKELQRAWYQRNKEHHAAKAKEHRNEVQTWLRTYKSSLKCERCGEDHPACLQFHHSDPSTKDSSVREAVRNNCSIEKLKEEIAKCEVLCANCHFKEHWQDKTDSMLALREADL